MAINDTITPSPETPVSGDAKVVDLAMLPEIVGGMLMADPICNGRVSAGTIKALCGLVERAATTPTPSADVSSLIEVVALALRAELERQNVPISEWSKSEPIRHMIVIYNSPAVGLEHLARAAIAAHNTETAIVLKRYREALEAIKELADADETFLCWKTANDALLKAGA
jgi:hypothetical protein